MHMNSNPYRKGEGQLQSQDVRRLSQQMAQSPDDVLQVCCVEAALDLQLSHSQRPQVATAGTSTKHSKGIFFGVLCRIYARVSVCMSEL